MADRKDRLRIVNQETGDAIEEWESAEVSSDYLTPCDTFKFEAGDDDAPVEIARRFPPGAPVVISAILDDGREAVLIDGVVDSVSQESARDGGGGRRLVVEGRDFLGVVVDANVDPRISVPAHPTVEQLLDLVLKGEFGLDFNQVEENVKTHQAIGPKLKKRPPTRPSRKRRKAAKVESEAKPRDGESGWSYLDRILTQYGYHLSAARSPDNRYVVVAGPNYDQDVYYTLRQLRGAGAAANNVARSVLKVDESGVPSHVFVKGSGPFSAGDLKKNTSVAKNAVATRFKPVFLVDQRAKDRESTERIARAFLGRCLRNFVTYEAHVQGIVDEDSGALYCVDTLVNVFDDDKGLRTSGGMWVESCTTRVSRKGGTTTDLKLIPRGTLVLDWQPDEEVDKALDFAAALAESLGSKSFNKTRSFQYNGVEFWAPK